MQYRVGTADFRTGVITISFVGTSLLSNISIGDVISKRNENASYTIGSVDSDTQVTLTSPYAGETEIDSYYQIVSDFTANLGLTEIHSGDRDWTWHLTDGVIRRLDNILSGNLPVTITLSRVDFIGGNISGATITDSNIEILTLDGSTFNNGIINSTTITNAKIISGNISGVTITNSSFGDLTQTRIPFVGSLKKLVDDANLVFANNTLKVPKVGNSSGLWLTDDSDNGLFIKIGGEITTTHGAYISGSLGVKGSITAPNINNVTITNTKGTLTISDNTTLSGDQDVRTSASPVFATVKLSNLTDGYVPVHTSDGVGFQDGVLKSDLDNMVSLKHKEVTIGLAHGLSISGQTLSLITATNSTYGAATPEQIQAIEINSAKVSNATHTGEVTGSTTLTITNKAVTFEKMQDISTSMFVGRTTAGNGSPHEISVSGARTLLNIEKGADQTTPARVEAAGAIMDYFSGIENMSVELSAPSSNNSSHGVKVSLPAGESISRYNLCQLRRSDGKVVKASSSAGHTMPVLYMATEPLSLNSYGLFLKEGIVRDDSWNWIAGQTLYAGTGGNLVTLTPYSSGECIQIVGFAITSTVVEFSPKFGWIELA